ncbi:MAG: hypothetical protein MZV64_22185 [Ignavibacteriales bacterium]|nr:hypothetical protein [Ignavibacteriales bacterium]
MNMKVVLKNVNVFQSGTKIKSKRMYNILIEDGIIQKIGELTEAEIKDAKVFDLDGKYVVPGFFDMHVHLREPGREDEETVDNWLQQCC